jgi:hypothetical protein
MYRKEIGIPQLRASWILNSTEMPFSGLETFSYFPRFMESPMNGRKKIAKGSGGRGV